jgi:hypothetical protein
MRKHLRCQRPTSRAFGDKRLFREVSKVEATAARETNARGFSMDLVVELINAGFATAQSERMHAGGRQTDVSRVRITEAGRRALAKMSK